MRQSLIIAITVVAGILALALALYFLFSDALSFELPSPYLALRPRMLVACFLAFGSYCLLYGAWRVDRTLYLVTGCLSIGLGLTVLWLIFSGSAVSVADNGIKPIARGDAIVADTRLATLSSSVDPRLHRAFRIRRSLN